ncbi:glutaminyl-peptide cyclotransferase [Parvularcula sp. ZS-1/3]|uniref:Glutaminyl-peptide cyclotransferase n=1 Tax=Parvularcula mediterranea TaxID=2732508 RepID=A0A7Y3RJT2_9PROT|nr:glutaminyl-peptide cyclotransferase [Parvularcula mediterranea]NNU15295.1 glutaminyl-peptide cyclotransferase [Parvularcula mediterranea]
MKISLLATLLLATQSQAPLTPQIMDVEVVRSFPHETDAFTQGFLFADGVLIESTGREGQSRLRKLSVVTGKPTQEIKLPDDVFGEGTARVGDKLVTLTWRSGQGFVFDLTTLQQVGAFAYEGEGWGLTYDGEKLIMSDGSSRLRFLDPETFAEIGGVDVTISGQALPRLNELEYVNGRVWANVYLTDFIVRIDPVTGKVDQISDLSALFPRERRKDKLGDVLNGIAYEEKTERLFVTGKNWPLMFEVNLTPRTEGQ